MVHHDSLAPSGFAFLRTPWPCRLWVTGAMLGACLLPVLLVEYGHRPGSLEHAWTALLLIGLSVANVEIGRVLEGGIADSQRPHKALSAWAFAAALVLPTWWLLPVTAVTYGHARWRGLRVPLWKWAGSAAYLVLAAVAAAVTARALVGDPHDLMHGDGSRGLVAVATSAAVFLAVETLLFHGSAYLNVRDDEAWLRETLASRSFYLTEGAVLLVGGLSAAIWMTGAWFVLLLVPVYALTQRAALHEPLRVRAEHDDKTGTLRFESWRRLALNGVERCRGRGQPWCVLFADLDHFKAFNDTWGHLAGDDALAAVAEAIGGELRSGDLLARFGGEEFCAFLPDTSAETGYAVAERVRAAVDATRVRDAAVTVSLGVGASDCATEPAEFAKVLAAADRALFRAKAEGRDRTVVEVLSG
ncbi:GGDEF domain-containing protein [Nocardioides panacisoli]|uniref:GGDEF domain-containing protein n=1 Tax=Nocardioides panacisoli TaxID=627624 RepID=A0ABP7IQE1_9ACTN